MYDVALHFADVAEEHTDILARLVRESKRNVVKLPHDYHYQREFMEASRKIERLRLPRKFRICK